MKKFTIGALLLIGIMCYAQNTYVPDDNFEQALIDLGYDNPPLDDYVPTTNVNTIISLSMPGSGISDLTGIEDFTALVQLNVNANDLSSIDITNLTSLSQLAAGDNNLTNIDLTQNINLLVLLVYGNQLTNLNISQNLQLIQINVDGNNISSLDVSQHLGLENLSCRFNQLSALNVSNNSMLEGLFCSGNQISSIDVSASPNFRQLIAFNNTLTHLDIKNGNNTNVLFFDTRENPELTCIIVDDAIWSEANWLDIDPNSTFVNNQSECKLLNAPAFEELLFIAYPNPAKNTITIEGLEAGNYNLINHSGQQLQAGTLTSGTNTLHVAHLPGGIYFLEVTNNKGKGIQKIVKQ